MEQQSLNVLLEWLVSALTALFSNACLGSTHDSPEQKRLLMGLLRINSVEAFSVAVLAALIVSYRTYDYGNLSLLMATPGFEDSVSAAVAIVSRPGGGHAWRQHQFGDWKRDHLVPIFRNEKGSLATAGCRVCWGCAGPTLRGGSRLVCSQCKFAVFCSNACFKEDWKFCHKRVCKLLRAHRDSTRDGRHRSLEGMIASTYYKWKSGKGHWKPMVKGFPHFQAFVDVLDSREQPSEVPEEQNEGVPNLGESAAEAPEEPNEATEQN